MASLTTVNVLQDNHKKFSHKAMREVMKYLSTYNTLTHVLRMDGGSGSPDIDTTTAGLVMMNGQPINVLADAQLDISADTTEESLTAWVTATSYATVGAIRENQDGVRFRMILAHTSSADDEPMYGGNWETYWEAAPHGAVQASGDVIADDYDQWYMVTAQADGTLTVWMAGDVAAIGTAECKVPQYDHKMYCVIGFMHVSNETAADFTLGDDDLDDATGDGVTTTFLQVVGPVFPHPDNWDAN